MNKNEEKKTKGVRAGKECAYAAVFVALLIAAQLCLTVIPGLEIVTVLFLPYAFVFGARRGMLVATAFSLLRQLVFGFFPTVLVVYLLYFNLAAILFGGLGRAVKNPVKALWWLTLVACLCTLCFSMLDNVITPLWYGYTKEAAKAYFISSLPVAGIQVGCTAVSVALLFLPLRRAFSSARKRL